MEGAPRPEPGKAGIATVCWPVVMLRSSPASIRSCRAPGAIALRLYQDLSEDLPDLKPVPQRDFGLMGYPMSRPILETTLHGVSGSEAALPCATIPRCLTSWLTAASSGSQVSVASRPGLRRATLLLRPSRPTFWWMLPGEASSHRPSFNRSAEHGHPCTSALSGSTLTTPLRSQLERMAAREMEDCADAQHAPIDPSCAALSIEADRRMLTVSGRGACRPWRRRAGLPIPAPTATVGPARTFGVRLIAPSVRYSGTGSAERRLTRARCDATNRSAHNFGAIDAAACCVGRQLPTRRPRHAHV
jgi:hypothetical protein